MTALLAWLDHPYTTSEYFWMYLLGGMVVVCLTFALGEGCTLILLLAAATLTWAASQGTAVAYWQVGGLWAAWFSVVAIIAAVWRRMRIRRWRQARAEIERAKRIVTASGRSWDYELERARRRHVEREQMYFNVGLGDRQKRLDHYSD